MIKSIETVYAGITFRSRLEASWAVFLDCYEMPWVYEVEGYDLDGTWYLPDFWLPKCRTFLEIKGVMDDASADKVARLAQACAPKDILVIVGEAPVGTFKIQEPAPDDGWGTTNLPGMCRCEKCGGRWFLAIEGSFRCRCCGEHDGDHHLAEMIYSDELARSFTPPGFRRPHEKARTLMDDFVDWRNRLGTRP